MAKPGSIIAYLGTAESQKLAGKRRRRRPRRLPRWRYPAGVESRYVTTLVALVNAIDRLARQYIRPNLERWVSEDRAARGDSLRTDAWFDEVSRAVGQMRIALSTSAQPFDPERMTRNVANETDEYNRAQWVRISRAAVGVNILTDEPWIQNVVGPFVNANVNLVTNLAEDYVSRIEETVMRGVRSDARHEQIAKDLFANNIPGSAYRSAKNRAKLIARDQIGKLNGQLTQQRQVDVGVDEYIWRTAGDVRVRGTPGGPNANSRYSHYSRDGKKFKWSEPPADGHPGEPISCRCYAEPVFGDEFDSEEVKNAPLGRAA